MALVRATFRLLHGHPLHRQPLRTFDGLWAGRTDRHGNLTPGHNFYWDGIILAGYVVSTFNDFRIYGLLVGGLDNAGLQTDYNNDTWVRYDRCKAFKAGRRLSHFRPVGATWWESM